MDQIFKRPQLRGIKAVIYLPNFIVASSHLVSQGSFDRSFFPPEIWRIILPSLLPLFFPLAWALSAEKSRAYAKNAYVYASSNILDVSPLINAYFLLRCDRLGLSGFFPLLFFSLISQQPSPDDPKEVGEISEDIFVVMIGEGTRSGIVSRDVDFSSGYSDTVAFFRLPY